MKYIFLNNKKYRDIQINKKFINDFVKTFYNENKNKHNCIINREEIQSMIKGFWYSGPFKDHYLYEDYNEDKPLTKKLLFGFKSGIVFIKDGEDDSIIRICNMNGYFSLKGMVIYLDEKYDHGMYNDDSIRVGYQQFYTTQELSKETLGKITDIWLEKWGKYSDGVKIKNGEISVYRSYLEFKHDKPYHELTLESEEYELLKKFIYSFIKECFHFKKEKHLEYIQRESEDLKKLKSSKNSILSELDKDGNGIIDVIEGSDDFDKLFKKNQKKIIENDKTHIQQFVKISKYLRTKRNNIQETFTLITNSPKQESLDDLVGMLKNQIHTYEVLVFNSLTMIVSIIEEDLITFYEIYELFDELNIFNSSFQNQVSDNLTEMNHKLGDLMYSIDSMERNIVKGFKNLSYDLEGIKISLDTNLKGIQSSLDIGNFITKFPNYPTYKLRNEYSKISGLDFGGGG